MISYRQVRNFKIWPKILKCEQKSSGKIANLTLSNASLQSENANLAVRLSKLSEEHNRLSTFYTKATQRSEEKSKLNKALKLQVENLQAQQQRLNQLLQYSSPGPVLTKRQNAKWK